VVLAAWRPGREVAMKGNPTVWEISATYGELALVGQPAAALLRSKP